MNISWANLWQVPEAISFILANRLKGNLDPGIFRYPTIRLARVENGDGVALLYMPTHTATVLESVGWAPELSAAHKAEAGMMAIEQIEKEAWAMGIREIFFVSSDERTDEFCEKLGYERLTCLRKRL